MTAVYDVILQQIARLIITQRSTQSHKTSENVHTVCRFTAVRTVILSSVHDEQKQSGRLWL